MLQQAITNFVGTNEKTENLSKKKLITLKKQMKSIELKNVISEIKTYLMGSVTEWRSKRLESLYLRVD